MRTDNKTLYVITDDRERYIFILWSCITLMASLIGDSIILVVTIKYNAIKLQKVIIAAMQHMAICDLLQTAFKVFPVTLAFITDRWVVGELLCEVSENMTWVCAGVTMSQTCTLTTLKLIILKYPLKSRAWSSRFGHKIFTSVWLLAVVVYSPVFMVKIIYLRNDVYFSYHNYDCNYSYTSPNLPSWYELYFLITLPVVFALSYIALIVTSIAILVVAKKASSQHGRTLRWEGVITVLLTVGVLLLSTLPFGVAFVTWLLLGAEHGTAVWRSVILVQYLNIMANLFIYSITVKSFRKFLKLKISQLMLTISTRRTQVCPERAAPPQVTTQELGVGSASFNPTVEPIELHAECKTRNTEIEVS